MCCFNMDQIGNSLQKCDKALKIEPTHTKCLYRKGLCMIKIGEKVGQEGGIDEKEQKRKQLEFLRQAKEAFTKVLQLDNKNKDVQDKLEDLIKTERQIKKKYNLEETKLVKEVESSSKTSAKEEAKKPEVLSEAKKDPVKKPPAGLSKDFLENITKSAINTTTSK